MEVLNSLIGASVGRIYMDDKHLTFVTDKGTFTLGVSKPNCPHTFFCDFHGASNLFGNRIKEIRQVPITEHNRNYRHLLPRHRSLQKKIGYRVFSDLSRKTPTLMGYEIITDGIHWGNRHSVFSVQYSPETPVPISLVDSTEHLFNEESRILKPVFRITPRTHIAV